MSDDTPKNHGAAPRRAGCRNPTKPSRHDLPLRDDCRYRKARMLVLLAYDATAASAAIAGDPKFPAARELRRAAVAAGSTVIREHEGRGAPMAPTLGKLGAALERGEVEGWLDSGAAETLRRLSSELGAV